jgi:microcystin-dependent protein
MEGYIAQILLFAGNFAPRNWALCQGQILPIASNTALFSLLGTTYGGNGTTNFALPNLQGRVAIGAGQGAGLSNYSLGQSGGVESVTLLATEIPAHTHTLKAVTEAGTTPVPTGNYLANTGALDKEYAPTGTQTNMNSGAISTVGGNQPHSNVQPYLGLNYVICLYGIFPSRN